MMKTEPLKKIQSSVRVACSVTDFRDGVAVYLKWSLPSVLVALAACCSPADAVEARLTVQETAGVARSEGIVSSGVPFAKGAVKDVDRLSVSVAGRPVAAQFTPLASWLDGSVRWALMTSRLRVPAGGKQELVVRDDGRNPAPAKPIRVTDGTDAVEVSTGPLRFSVSKKRFDLLGAVKIDGKERVTSAGRGLVLHTAGAPKQVKRKIDRRTVEVTEYDPGLAVVAGPPTEVVIEESGPMRAVILVRGRFPGVHNELIGYSARLTTYAGSKKIGLRVWLENDGAHGYKAKPEWFHFDGLAVELGVHLGGPVTAECEGARATGEFKVRQGGVGQDWTGLHYSITGQGEELAKGKRTDGVVTLSGADGTLTTAVRHFWQNVEKAIELDGDKLRVWLWPTDAQWPRPGVYHRTPRFLKYTLNALPGGVRKGHELVLDFSGQPAAETSAALSAPLAAMNPSYFAATEAANGLFAPVEAKSGDEDLDWKFKCWNNMATNLVDPESKGGLVYAATSGAEKGSVWFGSMDFGDICSPYGGNYGGWVAPRNLHHDWTWTVLLQHLRTGDAAYLDRGLAMARHQMEVDFNWSDRDAAPHRKLFRHDITESATHTLWSDTHHPQQPRAEKNWLAGIVLYYMLTGDPMARQCALRNYEGLQEDWIATVKSKPSQHLRLYPSLLTIRNLLSLHAITGEKKYLDDVQVLLDQHIYLRTKDWGPHLFNPAGELRGQDHQRVADQYCYGVATLCELHHRTGDEKLGALLKAGAEKEFNPSFYDAPLYLSDLYAYIGHQSGDKELVGRGMDGFIDTFPESRKPPVFLPGKMAWSERAAMVLQAGHILQWVCWKQDETARPQANETR